METPDKTQAKPGETAGRKAGVREDLVDQPRPKPEANLLFLADNPRFQAAVLRVEKVLFRIPVLKDFLLIFRPIATWNMILEQERGPAFVFIYYLLPLLLVVGSVEGHGLMLLGRQQVALGMHNRFLFPNVVVIEAAKWLLTLLLLCVAAGFVTSLANACHTRNRLTQSLVVLFHAIGPLCVVQMFNGFPHIFLWLTWLAGMILATGSLYHGLPRIMRPDPPSAMGLFMGSAAIVLLMMVGVCILNCFFVAGNLRGLERILTGVAARLF